MRWSKKTFCRTLAVRSRAVQSPLSSAQMSAPKLSKSLAMSACPNLAHVCSAVDPPCLSCTMTDHGATSVTKNRTISRCPLAQAMCKGSSSSSLSWRADELVDNRPEYMSAGPYPSSPRRRPRRACTSPSLTLSSAALAH